MTTRNYSSFLLRLWLLNDPDNTQNENPLVLQVQHLQSGATWRLNSLEELQNLLQGAMSGEPDWVALAPPQNEDLGPTQPGNTNR
ncbi:MAG: hypothetical protein HXX08_06715 [Chloroflexi bacterium]|uniref:Uncharacterized protein n=1 Tax=Candidatus Chlorohelix allophototropha TaxID=3003348 RepID=A0A8T7LZ22_9CHLR|nr:hypothetical protein [Chloroflexota bacterium]WJW67425.1 hypothetical protein OZ401_000691 [Chloroflexota bacterium L227-S17]